VKDTLMNLYKFYLKANEVVDDNRYKQDVNVIGDIEVDVNNLVNSKGIKIWKTMWKIEMRLRGIWLIVYKDPNDDKLNILGW
jgi:CRISPR/Cas system CMR-associated protein Cmr3 (group 5 of RAMP superfamily)